MDVRKQFEAKFPVPKSDNKIPSADIEWNSFAERYLPTRSGVYDGSLIALALHYNTLFEGFRAAHELLAKDAATTEMFRTLWQRGLMLQWMHHAAKRSAGDNFDQLVDAMREILKGMSAPKITGCSYADMPFSDRKGL